MLNKLKYCRLLLFILLCSFLLSSCATPTPHTRTNICSIFRQYPKWLWATEKTFKRWGVPVHVQMAIMYQESRFVARNKPPRTKLLGFIPWFRPSTAYGYSQALDSTWKVYKRSAGRHFVSRSSFSDASDFIGWFADQTRRRTGMSKWNTYGLYLAYHEGIGGYIKHTYRRKPWLIKVARKVKMRGDIYWTQLHHCYKSLKKEPWWRFW